MMPFNQETTEITVTRKAFDASDQFAMRARGVGMSELINVAPALAYGALIDANHGCLSPRAVLFPNKQMTLTRELPVERDVTGYLFALEDPEPRDVILNVIEKRTLFDVVKRRKRPPAVVSYQFSIGDNRASNA